MPSLSPPQPCFIAVVSLCTNAVAGHNHHQSSRSPPFTTTGHCNLNQTQTEAAASLVFDASGQSQLQGEAVAAPRRLCCRRFQQSPPKFSAPKPAILHLSSLGAARLFHHRSLTPDMPKSSLLSNLPHCRFYQVESWTKHKR